MLMAFGKDSGKGGSVNKARKAWVKASVLECKIFICELWEIKLLELNLERPVHVEFSPEQEKNHDM